ncbi:MAG: hypothetical protein U0800_25255 [Isosphaeraceae bacterium]
MIRTGYLRWEIEASDDRSANDRAAREVAFLARPGYRRVKVRNHEAQQEAGRFLRGEVNYGAVLETRERITETLRTIDDVGPHVFRYSESDRNERPRFWMEKLGREVSAFAHEVVRAGAKFPELVISNPALRAGYARMIEQEVFRVIEGRSRAEATIEDEPMTVEAGQPAQGIPELVAAELVRDVVEPREFSEFCTFDRVTIRHGDKYYRIPRRTHGLIEVWDARTLRGVCRLCVVFQDPGMPPSDEVVMKYLIAKHTPDMLWQIGVKFAPPTGKFDGAPPRRWSAD